jgi:hypothetical protein
VFQYAKDILAVQWIGWLELEVLWYINTTTVAWRKFFFLSEDKGRVSNNLQLIQQRILEMRQFYNAPLCQVIVRPRYDLTGIPFQVSPIPMLF